ncbi:hypothetical protein F2Q69_00025481 [Brassica cretica]|uniref:Uncharacterized protein n=1 Tax=Brassica cretica TaxID=69181 RepID=A0A8S9QF61_BRACR|nr:hypothetical protein F2Q69_00025481 [Brassica cretica]
MCLITLKSSGDEPDILTTEVSQFVRPIWLMHGDFAFLTIALTVTTVLFISTFYVQYKSREGAYTYRSGAVCYPY